MNQAWSAQYRVQVVWFISIRLEWLLPLTGLRATESGVDRRVFCAITVVSTLMSIVSWLAVVVSGI